ncbi:MAG: DUF4286 family protein [Ignavibacteria bacterium]|nr:DUF4286 family protein [Ignavibacteria bacterium]
MITYQVEVTVPDEYVERWYSYMTSRHINDVLTTGHFISAKLVRMIEPAVSGNTLFRVIYIAQSYQALESYRRECAPALQAEHIAMFGSAVSATRSITEDVWAAPL